MHLIDVHVLKRPEALTPPRLKHQYDQWREQCVDSLPSDVINVHMVEGRYTSNFLELRKEAYRYGTSKYVSFINDDDYLTGDPFTQCITELENDPGLCGVYTNSVLFDQTKDTMTTFFKHTQWTREYHLNSTRPVHEIAVIRRDVVTKAFDVVTRLLTQISPAEVTYLTTDAEQAIYTAAAAYGDWKFLSEVTDFVWRKHDQGRHKDTYASGQAIPLSRKRELIKLLWSI